MTDSIIEELHKYRFDRARRLNFDKAALLAELKKGEQKSRRAGLKLVSVPVKRAIKVRV